MKTPASFLSIAHICILLMLQDVLPLLLWALLLLVCLWSLLLSFKDLKRPSTLLANLLAMAVTLVLFVSVSVQQSVLLFVTMLLSASCLKLLQAGSQKRINNLCVLTFFTLPTVFLYHQSLLTSLISGGLLVLLLVILALNNTQQPLAKAARVTMYSFTLVLPLASVALVLVPKLPAFWQLPSTGSAKTGLNPNINPFNISQLTNSSELAFRAEFNSHEPKQPLYWRAMVHETFDGQSWKSTPLRPSQFDDSLEQDLPRVAIYLEPTQSDWLFGLGYSSSPSDKVINLQDGLLKKAKISNNNFKYEFAYDTPELTPLNAAKRANNLTVSSNDAPRLYALAQRMSQASANADDFANQLLSYYQQQQFTYTLNPPVMAQNSALDEFMFDVKRGFCGHYASVSTYAMRAAGIPARVVSGYLGAQQNQQGNYWSVYQYDAHAWVEYYNGERWQRFDATSVVAPERLSGSLADFEQLNDEFLERAGGTLFNLANFESLQWLRSTLEQWDHQWTKWILGFDAQQQQNMLKKWLPSALAKHSLAVLLCVISLVLLVWFLLAQKNSNKFDTFERFHMRRLMRKLDGADGQQTQANTPSQRLQAEFQATKLNVARAQVLAMYEQALYQQKPLSRLQKRQYKKHINYLIKNIGKQ